MMPKRFGIQKQLIPTAIESKQAEAGHLLLVQVNLFECGGLTIGVSISHKVADASTLSTFIKSWAAIALGSASTTDHVLLSYRVWCCIYSLLTTRFFQLTPTNCGIRYRKLCNKAASDTVPNPTRVEVVSALIWKYFIFISYAYWSIFSHVSCVLDDTRHHG
ncbi:hypothetical protein L3X38_022742 [Prunus dulcis]|uniref:HXXXD-type acyl-transferase family protein n=1 Tax=Prunus dulcis TaxID=3755 RepID=A0AAD4VWN5_PRUDU|nr:hypothetical protein L3X38_022742 [Prunus dulcis]